MARDDSGGPLFSWRALLPLAAVVVAALVVAVGLDYVDDRRAAAKERKKARAEAKEMKEPPKFVVGVRSDGSALVVRDIESGADVGLPVAAPEGRRFHRVAAGTDGTFVAAAATGSEVGFVRLELDEEGRPSELKPIPDAVVAGRSTGWSDMAVNRERIAYVTYKGKTGRIDVVGLNGERKAWTTPLAARIDSLSWAGDTLSFVWSRGGAHQVRMLDTSGASGDLSTSRAVLRLPAGGGAAVLNPDGTQVIAGGAENAATTVRAYDVATGEVTRDLWTRQLGGGLARLATDHGGRVLAFGGDGTLYGQDALAVSGGDLSDVAW